MSEEGTFLPILDHIEQFRALFENHKTVAGSEPKRLATFYSQSSAIRDAAEKLAESAGELTYNLEWFGAKRLGPVSAGFEQAWEEYKDRWAPAIAYGSFCERLAKTDESSASNFRKLNPYNPDIGRGLMLRPREQEEPDPDRDKFFDPVRHDGGDALALGVDHWRGEVHRAKLIANKCQIALDAFDYLMDPIGIDIADIFRRWRELPTIFMPPPVSNKHGEEKGSLNDLLDNAVRAYVCGAPAAAIAMCRAVLEMVLKTHYLTDEEIVDKMGNEWGLKKLISLAEARYSFLPRLRLSELKEGGDDVLHKYHKRERLSASDEKAIIDYMRTLRRSFRRLRSSCAPTLFELPHVRAAPRAPSVRVPDRRPRDSGSPPFLRLPSRARWRANRR
jgi:hypothetical protein